MATLEEKKRPSIDWLWAAVLERKTVYGYDLHKMSEIAGVSYPVMRRMIRVSPWYWPLHARESVCEAFGIIVDLGPGNIHLEGEKK